MSSVTLVAAMTKPPAKPRRKAAPQSAVAADAAADDPKRPVTAPGELRKIFSENLRLSRLELRLSQRELSDLSGISQNHISNIELMRASLTLDTLEALAKHVNRTPAELLMPRRR